MFWRLLSRNKKAVFIAASLFSAVILMTTSWRSSEAPGIFDSGVMMLTEPILMGTAAAGGFLDGVGDLLFGWKRLKEENKTLKEEVTRLRRESDAYREREKTYQRLSTVLDFQKEAGFKMTVAAVIGHDATNLFKTVLINKGYREGVQKNMAVMTPSGVVGRIIKVYPRSARVLLLTDRSSGIDALVQRTRDQGIVQGLGKETCEMKYLSRQAAVAVGDTIVTSGMGGIFPKGVMLGEVTNVKKGGYLLQKVEVLPMAELDRLEEVVVILEKQDQAEQ